MISLEQRQKDYAEAEQWAEHCAESWLDARARRSVTRDIEDQLDFALRDLKRAKRRLEETQKRAEKASA